MSLLSLFPLLVGGYSSWFRLLFSLGSPFARPFYCRIVNVIFKMGVSFEEVIQIQRQRLKTIQDISQSEKDFNIHRGRTIVEAVTRNLWGRFRPSFLSL